MVLDPEYLKIGGDIIRCAYEVRNTTRRGLREEYYKLALAWELGQLGYEVKTEDPIPVVYKGTVLSTDYKADIIVDNRVIIETKALGEMYEKQGRQLLTYLELSGIKLGYLINFGSTDFRFGKLSDSMPYRKGLYRIINTPKKGMPE